MRAIRIDGSTPGKVRKKLVESIPLNTPFLVQIFPVYACNFKCNYCIHSIEKIKRNYISDEVCMEFETFKKVVDDLKSFPQKIKMLRFAGTGEPLMHKDIAKMIRYAAESNIAESIDIVTNGSLLSKELSDELIESGLTRLRISIQGIDSLGYKNTSGVNIDFKEFVHNIRYFYENRKDTKIYIKIIDSALNGKDEECFFDIFGDICDEIAIEHLLPAVSQIDYSSISKNDSTMGQNGNEIQNVEVCPQPFYLMQVNPEGNIVPCCSMETACILGNVKTENLYDIWNGEKFNLFRKNQLMKKKNLYNVCKKCEQYKYAMFKEDVLDNEAENLIRHYE